MPDSPRLFLFRVLRVWTITVSRPLTGVMPCLKFPTDKMKPITSLVLVLTILQAEQYTAAASQQAAPFTLVVEDRVTGSNSITLRCKSSSGNLDHQAQFFLNGTRVDLVRGFVDTSRDRTIKPISATTIFFCFVLRKLEKPNSLVNC